MATLSTEDRQRVWRGLMRWWSNEREQVAGVSKGELQDAVDATDAWIEDNQTSFNSALPEAARTGLTLAQKTFLFCAVAMARVSIPLLRRMFGEVN